MAGCATDGFFGFDNKKQESKQWRVYYRKDEQIVFSIPLRGVHIEGVHIESYPTTGKKGKLSDMISSAKDRAKNPPDKPLPHLEKPPPQRALTHKGDSNGTSDHSDQARASKKVMRGGDAGAAAPAAKRLKRAAAAKAAESFGGHDGVQQEEETQGKGCGGEENLCRRARAQAR